MPSAQDDREFASAIAPPPDVTALDRAIGWIRVNLEPSEVFADKQLREWAEDNGYTEETE